MVDATNTAVQPIGNASPEVSAAGPLPSIDIERGVCYVFFAHEVGLSIDLNEAERRITATTYRQTIKHKRRTPEYFTYDPPPLRVTQNIHSLSLGAYQTTTTVEAMIYDFGSISLTYTIPLNGAISGMLALSDELYDNAILLSDARQHVEQLLAMIEPAVAKLRIAKLVEDYVIYQIEARRPAVALDQILSEHRLLLAQILRAEPGPLSEQEVKDALACRLNFGDDDVVIIDWNAAIVFDTDADDVRAVLEYTNVELLEMRYLDKQLDDALDESYLALTRRRWGQGLLFGSTRNELRRVAELQMDGALLYEGVNNAIKLLGDQYLARVYQSASHRLHLNDWESSILRKLQALESIYQKISDHHSRQRMEILEWIIIILIALSIVLSLK